MCCYNTNINKFCRIYSSVKNPSYEWCKVIKNFLVQSCIQSDYYAVKNHLYSIAIKKCLDNEIMKIEKVYVLIFFGCLMLSSITFLAYDHVNEEIKKYIIWVNILFFIIVLL